MRGGTFLLRALNRNTTKKELPFSYHGVQGNSSRCTGEVVALYTGTDDPVPRNINGNGMQHE